jgi:adenylate kinase
MRIIIRGVPGTGKTEVAKLVAERFGLKHVNREFFERFEVGYDEKRGVKVVDEVAASRELEKMDGFVAESHLPIHVSDAIYFTLRCEPPELLARLKRRGWNDEKMQENLQAEIFNECGGGIEIDTTNRDPIEVAEEIVRTVKEETG